MSWIFKKIFRFGPFRATLSKGGIGMSWGIPAFRIGISSNGQKCISLGIPRTGFYFIKYFSKSTDIENEKPSIKNREIDNEPWWKRKHLKE